MRRMLCWLALGLCGCSANGDSEFRDQFRWISGKWVMEADSILTVEQWHWNKFRFEGEGYELKGGDTTFHEHLYLESFNGKPCYIASVNNQRPVLFQGERVAHGSWEFVNPEHEMPFSLGYVCVADTALNITIKGIMNGEVVPYSYTLKRAGK